MVKKILSEKEEIQSKVDETVKGKTVKAEKKKATSAKKTTKSITRKKVVWKVFDNNFKEVACFSHLEKTEAYSAADALTVKKKKSHFVNEVNVPML